MAHWLLKTEPDVYGWEDLVRDGKAVWDGVTNALAQKHIRSMHKGDLALIYHTGDERAAVGIAQITSDPYPDPMDKEKRLTVFEIRPQQKLARAVTLTEIKSDKAFAGWDLIRNGRLGVVPTPENIWKRIEELAKETA